VSLALSLVAFGGGAWLLVESVEGLVKALTGWAAAAGLSGLALSALVLGFDSESTGAGVAATLDGLPGTALGTSVGAALFFVTVGLGLAAVVAPFSVRTPRPILVVAVLATAFPVALLADGTLSRTDGALLVLAFVPLVGVLVVSARRAGRAPEPDAERPRRLWLRLVAGIAGLVVGAEVLVLGTRGIVERASASPRPSSASSSSRLLSPSRRSCSRWSRLTAPARDQRRQRARDAALLLTGSLGVIALVKALAVPEAVTSFHAPALVLAVLLLLALLVRGRLGRLEGAVLIAVYGAYVIGALMRG